MNVLMLGNGFDLYHNLLTGYDDFMTVGGYIYEKYNGYAFDSTNVYDELVPVAQRKESIKSRLVLYEKAYKQTNIDSEEFVKFIELIKGNCWFDYFMKNHKRDGWVNLEEEIDIVLHCIKNNVTAGLDSFYNVFKRKTGYTDIAFSHIKKYIFSDGDGKISFEDHKTGDTILLKEYKDFVELLRLYLKIFVDNVLPNISNLYQFKNTFIDNSDYAISFNYTNTLRQFYNLGESVIHIHGKLDSDIIVGINSNECDNVGNGDIRFIGFKKYYQRITKNTFMGLEKLINCLNSNQGGNCLKIIGHSLDPIDADIISVIFDWFKNIVIYYYDEKALDDYVKNLKYIFGAKDLSEMTFSQKIIFKKLPANEYIEVN